MHDSSSRRIGTFSYQTTYETHNKDDQQTIPMILKSVQADEEKIREENAQTGLQNSTDCQFFT